VLPLDANNTLRWSADAMSGLRPLCAPKRISADTALAGTLLPGNTRRRGATADRRSRRRTAGWQFSGDALRFAGGWRPAVCGARKALSADIK
jgi:hypothetical protein